MASTFTNLLYHIVYSTKYRHNLIHAPLQEELYRYIGGIIRENRGTQLEIGGMPDHIHILAKLSYAQDNRRSNGRRLIGGSRTYIFNKMSDAIPATQILQAIEQGDPEASDRLLPLVYDELRRLASQRLAREQPGQTLQPTALVHEAYLRLVDVEHQQKWNSRGHFFAAAAEAMRRILVENARRKGRIKHGGELARQEFDESIVAEPKLDFDLLALDEALDRFSEEDERAAQLVKLRYFSGLTVAQAAEVLDISTRSAERMWTYAKAWLFREIRDD